MNSSFSKKFTFVLMILLFCLAIAGMVFNVSSRYHYRSPELSFSEFMTIGMLLIAGFKTILVGIFIGSLGDVFDNKQLNYRKMKLTLVFIFVLGLIGLVKNLLIYTDICKMPEVLDQLQAETSTSAEIVVYMFTHFRSLSALENFVFPSIGGATAILVYLILNHYEKRLE